MFPVGAAPILGSSHPSNLHSAGSSLSERVGKIALTALAVVAGFLLFRSALSVTAILATLAIGGVVLYIALRALSGNASTPPAPVCPPFVPSSGGVFSGISPLSGRGVAPTWGDVARQAVPSAARRVFSGFASQEPPHVPVGRREERGPNPSAVSTGFAASEVVYIPPYFPLMMPRREPPHVPVGRRESSNMSL